MARTLRVKIECSYVSVFLLTVEVRQDSRISLNEGVQINGYDVLRHDVSEIKRRFAISADEPTCREVPAALCTGLYVVVERAFFRLVRDVHGQQVIFPEIGKICSM